MEVIKLLRVKWDWENEEQQLVKIIYFVNEIKAATYLVNLNNENVEPIEVEKELLSQIGGEIDKNPMELSNIIKKAKQFAKLQNPYPKNIKWYKEEKDFDTLHESHEWIYSGIYNEIGNLYEGYITRDIKLAYFLVYELIRANTMNISPEYKIYSHEEKDHSDQRIFRVWVRKNGGTVLIEVMGRVYPRRINASFC